MKKSIFPDSSVFFHSAFLGDSLTKKQYWTKDISETGFDDLEVLAALAVQASPAGGRSFLGRMSKEESQRYQRELEAHPERFERYLRRF